MFPPLIMCQFCLLLYLPGIQMPKIITPFPSDSFHFICCCPCVALWIHPLPGYTSFCTRIKRSVMHHFAWDWTQTKKNLEFSFCFVFTWHTCNERYKIIKKYGGILTTKDLRKHKTNWSAPQTASQPLRAHRHGFVRAELDLWAREDGIVSVTDDLSSERSCVTTFETAIEILTLVVITAARAYFWQSESPESKWNWEQRALHVQFDLEVKGHPIRPILLLSK